MFDLNTSHPFDEIEKLRQQQYAKIIAKIMELCDFVYTNIELFSPRDTNVQFEKKKKRKQYGESSIIDPKSDMSIYGSTSHHLNEEDLEYLSHIIDPLEYKRESERKFQYNKLTVDEIHRSFATIHRMLSRLDMNAFELPYTVIQKIEAMLLSFTHHDHTLLMRGIAAFEHAERLDGSKIPFSTNEEFLQHSVPFFFTEPYISMIVRVLKKYSSNIGNITLGSQNPVLMHFYVSYVGHEYDIEDGRLEDAKEAYEKNKITKTQLFQRYQRTLQKLSEYAEIVHKGGLFQTEEMEVHNLQHLLKEVKEFYEKELRPVTDTLAQKNIDLYMENVSNLVHFLTHGNLNRKKVLVALHHSTTMNPLKFQTIVESARKSLETFQEHVDTFENPALPMEERLRKLEDMKVLFEKLLDINLKYLDTIDEDYHD